MHHHGYRSYCFVEQTRSRRLLVQHFRTKRLGAPALADREFTQAYFTLYVLTFVTITLKFTIVFRALSSFVVDGRSSQRVVFMQ